MEDKGTILSVTRVVTPGKDYEGTYRVMWEREDGGMKTDYTFINGEDELDAYRRFKRWLALPYPGSRGNGAGSLIL